MVYVSILVIACSGVPGLASPTGGEGPGGVSPGGVVGPEGGVSSEGGGASWRMSHYNACTGRQHSTYLCICDTNILFVYWPKYNAK